MLRFLKLAQKFNCFYLTGFNNKECRPFIVDGQQVGLIRPNVLKQLFRHSEMSCFRENDNVTQEIIELNPAFRDYNERSETIDKILRAFRNGGAFVTLKGWCDDCYEVKTTSGNSLLKMERSATCLFGIRNFGVDINGCVRHPTKELCIWLQQRSVTKQTWLGSHDEDNIDVVT